MPDILFTPTNPISGRYHVDPQTLLGIGWCDKYCISCTAYSTRDIRQLTARLNAMNLTWKIDWSFAIEAVA